MRHCLLFHYGHVSVSNSACRKKTIRSTMIRYRSSTSSGLPALLCGEVPTAICQCRTISWENSSIHDDPISFIDELRPVSFVLWRGTDVADIMVPSLYRIQSYRKGSAVKAWCGSENSFACFASCQEVCLSYLYFLGSFAFIFSVLFQHKVVCVKNSDWTLIARDLIPCVFAWCDLRGWPWIKYQVTVTFTLDVTYAAEGLNVEFQLLRLLTTCYLCHC